MDREYDIFERLPEGSPIWRGYASGLSNACVKLFQVATATSNQCFLICLATKEIMARVNIGAPHLDRKRIVCQISYDPQLGCERDGLLRLHGYGVISVFGNDAAQIILSTTNQRCDAFIVGHGAPQKMRCDILIWLKQHFPRIPVVVTNGPETDPLSGADYNVSLEGQDTWLAVVAIALGKS